MLRVRSGRIRRIRGRAYGALLVKPLLGKGPFSVQTVFMKPGTRHASILHARTSEFFLVMEGSTRAWIRGRSRRLQAGDFVFLPPGTPHAFQAGARGTLVLAVFEPPLDLKAPDIMEAS
jgi:quercetin 2,3-dioxygenase